MKQKNNQYLTTIMFIVLMLITGITSAQTSLDTELLAFTPTPTKMIVALPPPPPPYKSTYENSGPGIMIGGGSLLVAGLLSSPEWYGHDGPDKPFFENPPRAAVVIVGGVLLATGFVVSLTF